MRQSDNIASLAAALVKAQAELKAVAKDATNPDFRSKYATLDLIIAEVRPVLAKHGLAIVQGATTPHSDDTGRIAAIAVESMLVHQSGEWITNTAIMPVVGRMLKGGGRAEVDPQAGGSALTYGRRYGIAALLCIATDEDDDGNRASKSGAKEPGRAASRSAAATTQPAATASSASAPAPVLTRDSLVPFAPKRRDGTQPTVKELPHEFLAWACEEGRKLGAHTAEWQVFLRAEKDAREVGELARV